MIAGHDRDFVAALVFPNLGAVPRRSPGCPPTRRRPTCSRTRPCASGSRTLLDDARAREHRQLDVRGARRSLLDEPPSLDAREITDKGSLNQKAVLQHRAALVEELYAASPSARVLQCAAPDRDTVASPMPHRLSTPPRSPPSTCTCTSSTPARPADADKQAAGLLQGRRRRATRRRWPSTTARARWRASSSPWTRR